MASSPDSDILAIAVARGIAQTAYGFLFSVPRRKPRVLWLQCTSEVQPADL